jgi:flavin reductase (DIM6/NTAB) family NADH-FMN oxidoreductase RutF
LFTVNVIPEGGKKLIAHFGKGFELGEPAFEGLEVRRDAETPPILHSAHAYLACRVNQLLDVGDHMLVVGGVVAGAVLQPGQPSIHVRKNGLNY